MIFRKEVGESLTLKFAESANERRKAGMEIISLGLGEPDFAVPKELVDATVRVLQTKKSGYSSPLGLPSLREKLANQFAEVDGIPCAADNIIITPGAKQSMQLALMALLEPEDEVVVINPSFVSFVPQIYIAEPKAKVVVVDLKKLDFSLPQEDLLAAVNSKTKVLILNSPSNPAGTVFSDEEIKWVYELAEKHDFYIISDEVYKRLSFTGKSILSVGSIETSVERVFTVNGYSKSHAITGWRFGFMSFPDAFKMKLLKLQQHINTNTCTFIQQAIDEAFGMDMSFLQDYNQELKKRAARVGDGINGSRLSLVRPEAGFFAFVNMSELGLDSNTFCSRLISETGVATTPGLAFGAGWDDHFRLSYAVEPTVLERGLEKIVEFSNKV